MPWRVVIRDVMFEPTGPALGPKPGMVGLLHDLNESYWAHTGLRKNSLVLKGYTAKLNTGL